MSLMELWGNQAALCEYILLDCKADCTKACGILPAIGILQGFIATLIRRRSQRKEKIGAKYSEDDQSCRSKLPCTVIHHLVPSILLC